MLYKWEIELLASELSDSDELFIDYTYISEQGFLLIILLTNHGNLQLYYIVGTSVKQTRIVSIKSIAPKLPDASALCILPNATKLGLILSSGDVLLVSLRSIFDVPWGVNDSTASDKFTLIDVEDCAQDCLYLPTAAVCFDALYYNRTFIVYSNKAGQIRIIDLAMRKLSAVLQAPESIHALQTIISDTSVHLLVTGFTGAQWVLPLEVDGNSPRGTLSQLIPSDLNKIDDTRILTVICNRRISSLNTAKNELLIYEDIGLGRLLSTIPVPEYTWIVHTSENAVFAMTTQAMFFTVHFGLVPPKYSLSYEELKPTLPSERILGTISSISPDPVPSFFLVTIRQLIFISPDVAVDEIAAARVIQNSFSLDVCDCISSKLNIDQSVFLKKVISVAVKKWSDSKDVCINEERLMNLVEITLEIQHIDIAAVMDMFAEYGYSYLFLPAVLKECENDANSELRHRVLNLYFSRLQSYPNESEQIEQQIRAFFVKYRDLSDGIQTLAKHSFWRCISIIVGRSNRNMRCISSHILASDFVKLLPERIFYIVKSLLQLNWDILPDVDALFMRMCEFLPHLNSVWQMKAFTKIALQRIEKNPQNAVVLYALSILRIISSAPTISNSESTTNAVVSCGSNCTAIVAEDESLMFWGELCAVNSKRRNSESADANSSVPFFPNTLRSEKLPDRICSVSCGTEHVLCLTTSGQLYSFGINRFGQCGVGHKLPVEHLTEIVGNFAAVKFVRAGQYHSFLIDANGCVFSWGWSLFGQLALEMKACVNDVLSPIRVKSIYEPVVDISCGYSHTVFLTESGSVLTCGGNTHGQLGCSQEIRMRYEPNIVRLPEKVVMLSCNFFHTCALSASQKLYEWGISPQNLRLKSYMSRRFRSASKDKDITSSSIDKIPGHSNCSAEYYSPVVVEQSISDEIVQIAAGYTHNALITKSGLLYTWGKSFEMQLGHGNKKEQEEPHQVFEPSGVSWRHVSCGLDFTVAIASDATVYGCGRNDRGHLGIPTKSTALKVRKYTFRNDKGVVRSINLNSGSCMSVATLTKVPFAIAFIEMDGLSFDECASKLIKLLKNAEPRCLTEISSQLLKNPVNCSASIYIHLLAGDLISATNVLAQLTNSVVDCTTPTGDQDPETSRIDSSEALLELMWRTIAKQPNFAIQWSAIMNLHSILCADPRIFNSKKVNALIPCIFTKSNAMIENLSGIDKLNLLEMWKSNLPMSSGVEIAQKDLTDAGGRIRYWNCCGTIEKNPRTASPFSERKRVCKKCSDAWKQVVKSKLSRF